MKKNTCENVETFLCWRIYALLERSEHFSAQRVKNSKTNVQKAN